MWDDLSFNKRVLSWSHTELWLWVVSGPSSLLVPHGALAVARIRALLSAGPTRSSGCGSYQDPPLCSAGGLHPARWGPLPREQAVPPLPPQLHLHAPQVLHGRHAHRLRHRQRPDGQLRHQQVSLTLTLTLPLVAFSRRFIQSNISGL